MDGATVAAPGYESVPSDSLPFNLGNYGVKRYSPVEPGPIPKEIAETFTGASYSEVTLSKDTVLYRVYGGDTGKVGRYLTNIPQNGGMHSQLDFNPKIIWIMLLCMQKVLIQETIKLAIIQLLKLNR